MFKSIIIGDGEIGKSLFEVIGGILASGKPQMKELKDKFEILHICFPYSDEFLLEVKRYQKLFNPKYTVIHSTVPVGTSRKCGAIHSPVIGIHPYLQESFKVFTKFLGGEQAGEIADYFRRAGIKVYITDKSETTELMKLMDTTHYGIEIEFVKDIKRQCNKYNVPFEMWSLWVDNYNQGYERLGHSEYKKPNLIPNMKKIAGHCVLPNAKLIDTKFTHILNKLST
jgi:hypothetical protein